LAAAKAAKKGKGGDKPKGDAKAPKEKPAEAKPKAPAAKPAAATTAPVAAPTAALTMTYPSKQDKELNTKLNHYESVLEKNQYIYGNQLTSLDNDFFKFLQPHGAKLNGGSHPNVVGHFMMMCRITPKMRDSFPVVEDPQVAKVAAAKKEADDLDDLFGDDDADDGAAAKAAAQAAKDKAKKPKKKVIAMSLVMLEVKPLDDTIDLDALAQKLIAEVTQEGLFWKTEFKKEPVAFGIFKLIIGFSCEDEKVSVDDIVERIEGYEEHVQSVEIAAFNKI
jgi:elongation factor 1-beta